MIQSAPPPPTVYLRTNDVTYIHAIQFKFLERYFNFAIFTSDFREMGPLMPIFENCYENRTRRKQISDISF